MTNDVLQKARATRLSLARDCAKLAAKSEIAKSNSHFVKRVYWLVANGVCDNYAETLTYANS